MAILRPELGEGMSKLGASGPRYYATLISSALASGSVDTAFPHATLQEAVDDIEKKLTVNLRPGDIIEWGGERYHDVPSVMRAIRANPVTTPLEP